MNTTIMREMIELTDVELETIVGGCHGFGFDGFGSCGFGFGSCGF
ncbi:MAG TPA: hypothetical protein VGN34_04990 [Ktedonobacteraceae bacterium]